MLVVHHLNDSRSQRILWLLEELGAPYEIKHYARDATTRLAPPELKAVHPLGKSPVITDGDVTINESGAIVDYIVRKYGPGKLAPPAGTGHHEKYLEWLHYAEGSAMLPLMLNMYVGRLGEAGAALHPRIQSEMANHLSYVEGALEGRDWLMGGDITAADIQMSFVGEVARAMGQMDKYPNIKGWVERFQARPAYQTALEKGGPYNLGLLPSRGLPDSRFSASSVAQAAIGSPMTASRMKARPAGRWRPDGRLEQVGEGQAAEPVVHGLHAARTASSAVIGATVCRRLLERREVVVVDAIEEVEHGGLGQGVRDRREVVAAGNRHALAVREDAGQRLWIAGALVAVARHHQHRHRQVGHGVAVRRACSSPGSSRPAPCGPRPARRRTGGRSAASAP